MLSETDLPRDGSHDRDILGDESALSWISFELWEPTPSNPILL